MDVPISIGVLLASAMSFYETATGGEHAYFESVVMLLVATVIVVNLLVDLSYALIDPRLRGRA